MAIALDIQRGVDHRKMLTLEFPVVEIASSIGWDSGICKKELKNMEWTTGTYSPVPEVHQLGQRSIFY